MNPFLTKNYSFDLPEALIALTPLPERTDSRLLVVKRKTRKIVHSTISELPAFLDSSFTMVANNTQVFKARLMGERIGTGGKIEFFLLKKIEDCIWQGLMKANFKIRVGQEFRFLEGSKSVDAVIMERAETLEGAIITARFTRDPVESELGEVPLPPYILSKRKALTSDELENYNTVFAKEMGSVAAPTAGRHFTAKLIEALKAKKIDWNEITLHVGLGTFKPVGTEDLREHTMHSETTTLSPEVCFKLNLAKSEGNKILAIGTTTVRTLEGRAMKSPSHSFFLEPGTRDVNLFIHPGSEYQFKFVDAILTNFHLPESTLFMMIATFIGDTAFLHEIYQTAIREKYRFYSYGDAMLILDE